MRWPAATSFVSATSCAAGLLTRLAVLPTITIMLVAIATTKIPILLERGFWDMAHAARTDMAMLLGSVFLLIVGAGRASVDARPSGDRGRSEILRSQRHSGVPK